MDRRYESERQDIIVERRCKKILSGKTLVSISILERFRSHFFFRKKSHRRINYFRAEFVISTRIVKSCLAIKTWYYYELNCMLKTNNATNTKIIEFKNRLKTNYSPINLRNSFPKCITTSCTQPVFIKPCLPIWCFTAGGFVAVMLRILLKSCAGLLDVSCQSIKYPKATTTCKNSFSLKKKQKFN